MSKIRLKKGSNNLSRMTLAERNSMYRSKCCTFRYNDKLKVGIVRKFIDKDLVEVMHKDTQFVVSIHDVKF